VANLAVTFIRYSIGIQMKGEGYIMRELLESLSKEELIDFIVEYAGNDAKFANAINVRFREPDFSEEPDFYEELWKIESIIDHEL